MSYLFSQQNIVVSIALNGFLCSKCCISGCLSYLVFKLVYMFFILQCFCLVCSKGNHMSLIECYLLIQPRSKFIMPVPSKLLKVGVVFVYSCLRGGKKIRCLPVSPQAI